MLDKKKSKLKWIYLNLKLSNMLSIHVKYFIIEYKSKLSIAFKCNTVKKYINKYITKL